MIDRDRALIERLLNDRAIKGLMADFLTVRFQQTAALLSAARDEGRAEGLGGWEPIETANKLQTIDILTRSGSRFIDCRWFQASETYGFWINPYGHIGQSGWPAPVPDPAYWITPPAPPASQIKEG